MTSRISRFAPETAAIHTVTLGAPPLVPGKYNHLHRSKQKDCYNPLMHRPTSQGILFLLSLALGLPAARAQSWNVLTSGLDTNLRGISAAKISSASHIAIWASGSHGVILRSLDDGATWTRLAVPGEPDLDFRGVVAISGTTAYLMSSGEGDKSRIYKTADGGATWELQFTDVNKAFFLDSVACVSEIKCFALGDPINAKFLILQTADGHRWNPLPPQNLPTALPKEGAFAASNSNLLVTSGSELFVATGAFAARVLHTSDGGNSWSAAAVPIAADNASSGIFAITFSTENHFLAVGGDYANPGVALRIAAFSDDRSKTWQSATQQPSGFRSAVAALGAQTFLAVGTNGSDLSQDAGVRWKAFASQSFNALFALDAQHVFAAGPKGVIAQFVGAESK
ncbi:MAG: hypothetical protein DMG34_06970 [Acidobacteria bacterium]|nr:MAG: hypothetical protein DMG34_06970 [Acidobacteriota bacterium]